MPIRVLIVDDQREVRLLVRRVIEASEPDIVVDGEATSGREALELAASLDPDVIVLDERMPDMDGLETARRIRELRPQQRIILFSAYVDARLERSALEVGISACINKSGVRAIPEAIVRVAVDGCPMGDRATPAD